MNNYRHTQIGWATIALDLLVGAILVALWMRDWPKAKPLALLFTAIVFVLFLTTFCALTIEVGGDRLAFRFGIGVFAKSYPLAEVESANVVHNPWYYMWGVKLVPGGWLYAVGPGSAVEIRFKNGKMLRLGTDDPSGLRAAIEAGIR